MNFQFGRLIGVLILGLVAGNAQAQVFNNLSTLGQTCTSRTTVSGLVTIPVQVSGVTQVQVRSLQYNESVADFVFLNSSILSVDPAPATQNLVLNTRLLRNGWANVDVVGLTDGFVSGSFTVYLWVDNSTFDSVGELLSLGGGGGGGGGVTVDTVAPSIVITSAFASSNTLSLQVSALDNVGVTKVTCAVDGASNLNATSIVAPFSMQMNIKRVKRGSHSVTCKAYDAAGNVATSLPAVFTK